VNVAISVALHDVAGAERAYVGAVGQPLTLR
jgi:hypothetical protein